MVSQGTEDRESSFQQRCGSEQEKREIMLAVEVLRGSQPLVAARMNSRQGVYSLKADTKMEFGVQGIY